MQKSAIPGWFGWPSKQPAPEGNWLPGLKLRIVVLALLYTFLAFSLTVDYAASVPFFLLAIIGVYVGLRRGFINGLTRSEKILMLIFAAYPFISILSYLVGLHTAVGFRFLGRDLKFLLFIPIFLATRWAKPRRAHVGLSLAVCVAIACLTAFLQHQPWPAPTPHGVAGTHITFGDISLLSGLLAAFLLINIGLNCPVLIRISCIALGVASLFFGSMAATLAHARGAWLASPFLLLILLWSVFRGRNLPLKNVIAYSFMSILIIMLVVVFLPNIKGYIRIAYGNIKDYKTATADSALTAHCVDSRPFLKALLRRSETSGNGHVYIKPTNKDDQRSLGELGCPGKYHLNVTSSTGSRKPFSLRIFRGTRHYRAPVSQTVVALIKGNGSIALRGRGPWTLISGGKTWHQYKLHVKSRRTQPLIIHTRSGKNIDVIPVQIPTGAFALALADSSIGQRLLMWNAGLRIFTRHPVLGVGTGAYHAHSYMAATNPMLGSLINKYEHAHSDYITSLSTKGILGFISLILLVMSPAIGLYKTRGVEIFYFAALLSSGFFIFAITETMFIHSLVIMWFTIVTAISVTLRNDLIHEKT